MPTEGTCDWCGDPNPVWYTSSQLWNQALEANISPGKLSRESFLCPVCFMLIHEKATGIKVIWSVNVAPTYTTQESK